LNQGEIWSRSEGDRWFDRNKDALDRFLPNQDVPLRLLEMYQLKPKRVLEVGASTGYRVAAIAERTGAHCVALDVSRAAVAYGHTAYPQVEFVVGEASSIPIGQPFDVVIVNFVLYVIDRASLLKTVAELDRVVGDGGMLLIGDFLPSGPTRVSYRHVPQQQMFSYKQDYASLFIESGLYRQVAFLASAHTTVSSGHAWNSLATQVSDQDRIGHWLLQKSLNGNYVTRELDV